jgi:hypothetical protein
MTARTNCCSCALPESRLGLPARQGACGLTDRATDCLLRNIVPCDERLHIPNLTSSGAHPGATPCLPPDGSLSSSGGLRRARTVVLLPLGVGGLGDTTHH